MQAPLLSARTISVGSARCCVGDSEAWVLPQGTLAQVQLQHSSREAELMAAADRHAQAREEWDRAAQRTNAQLADAQVKPQVH